MRIRSRDTAAVAIVLAVCSIVACGADQDSRSGTGRPTVRILTYDSYAIADEVLAEVERNTGIRLEVMAVGDSGALLARADLRAGRPEADVIVGIDELSLGRARQAGFAERGAAEFEATPFAEGIDVVDDRFVPVQRGDVCVNADRSWFTQRSIPLPSDLASLAEPRYAKLLVVPDPAASSPGLAFLVGAATELDDDFDRWLDGLAGGVGQAGSWDDAWNTEYTVNGGDRPLVVSYATSPPAEVSAERPEPASVVLEDTCVRQVEYAAVLAGSDQLESARKVIASMLTPRWQASLPMTNFVLPVVEGVELPDAFERFSVRPADPVLVGAASSAERDSWIAQWAAALS